MNNCCKQTFAEVEKIIDKWVTGHKTSWKYLQRKGLPDAEQYGDCIFLRLFRGEQDAIQELKEEIKNLKSQGCGRMFKRIHIKRNVWRTCLEDDLCEDCKKGDEK